MSNRVVPCVVSRTPVVRGEAESAPSDEVKSDARGFESRERIAGALQEGQASNRAANKRRSRQTSHTRIPSLRTWSSRRQGTARCSAAGGSWSAAPLRHLGHFTHINSPQSPRRCSHICSNVLAASTPYSPYGHICSTIRSKALGW